MERFRSSKDASARRVTEPGADQSYAPGPQDRFGSDTAAHANDAAAAWSVLGKTLVFKGELTANEDLLIQGRVEGSITQTASQLAIGAHGDVKGDITVVTWRTDLIADGTFDKYAEEFTAKYPDVKVTFEGITDYSGEMQTRMSTSNYGDVLGIPTISPNQYDQFLEPLGRPRTLRTPTGSSRRRAMTARSTASPSAATRTA